MEFNSLYLAMLELRDLPTLNAGLNATATVLICAGYVLIRRGRTRAHRNCMVAAFATSTVFLASYLVYHFQVPATRFQGPATVKPFYLALLASHVVLAVAVPPLTVVTLFRAFRGQLHRHRRIARITLPVWLYVSLTGVLVYLALYRLWPGPATR